MPKSVAAAKTIAKPSTGLRTRGSAAATTRGSFHGRETYAYTSPHGT